MKLIIDIPEEVYGEIQVKFLNTKVNPITVIDRAIADGTPLDESMTNADKFKAIFGIYATELWAKPEKDFLKWLNAQKIIEESRV